MFSPMTQELFLEARPFPSLRWWSRLRPIARKLIRLPVLHSLRPFARQAAAVARPAGRIFLQIQPAQPPAHDGRFLTILSANLYHDWPRYRRLPQRLEAVARLIEAEAADIVLLQEVARTTQFRSDEWLSDRLGMAYVYARANGDETAVGFEEGVAIYSRFPLDRPVLKQLGRESNPFTRRLGLGAQVELPEGLLPVFSVHLGLTPKINAGQMAHLQVWIDQLVGAAPAVIGGDFNAHETTSQINQTRQTWVDTFRQLHPLQDGATHELRLPWGRRRRRLDYLFLHGAEPCWQVLEAHHLDAPGGPHSDHRAVLARLKANC